jgi:hypothetical protein
MEMDPFGNEAFRDRAKMAELVARNAKRDFHGRATPIELDCWARKAVADLWCDDVRVTTFIPALALRAVGERIVAIERGGPAGTRPVAARDRVA